MFRVILVVFAIALAIVSADGDDKKKCHRLFHPSSMHCCKNELPPPAIDKNELAECFKIPPGGATCAHDICIGKKRGYATDDGTVDMDAWEKVINEDFKDTPSLVETIKDNCIKVDVSKSGPPHICHLAKLNMCRHKSIIIDCKEWDNEGPCTGLKDLVKECVKLDE